jgi:outer membrane protein assembly factor BamB
MKALGHCFVGFLWVFSVGCSEEDADAVEAFQCDAPQDGSWTQYGRDPGNTRCVKLDAFRAQPKELRTAWEVTGLTGSTSTPVSKDGVVYFGDWNGALHAVEEASGDELWSSTVAEGAPIRSTPTLVGDTIYAAFATLVAAYDAKTGEPRWVQNVDEQETAYIESSPIVVDDFLLVGLASYELTLDLEDYTFRGGVLALNKNTGETEWRLYTTPNDETGGAGVSVWSSVVIDPESQLAFVGTGNSYEEPSAPLTDSLLAIDYSNGNIVWQNQFTKDDVYTTKDLGPGGDFDVGATPTLLRLDDQDLIAVGNKAGIFKGIERKSGKTIWSTQLGTGSDIGGIMASAAYADGVLYVNSNDWVDYGFLEGENSPRDTSQTFAVDARTGNVVWTHAMSAPMFGGLTLVNGVVYAGLIDGSLIGLDAKSGVEVWAETLPGPIGAGVSVAGESLLVSYGFDFFKSSVDQSVSSGVRAYR